jgi:hypothetical protein
MGGDPVTRKIPRRSFGRNCPPKRLAALSAIRAPRDCFVAAAPRNDSIARSITNSAFATFYAVSPAQRKRGGVDARSSRLIRFMCGLLKITYDLLLLYTCRNVKPP